MSISKTDSESGRKPVSEQLEFIYSQGFTTEDVARLTRQEVEAVKGWRRPEAPEPDAPVLRLLYLPVEEIKGYIEQQRAIDALRAKRLSLDLIADLIGVGVDTVRHWDAGRRMASGWTRTLLLKYASSPVEKLPQKIRDILKRKTVLRPRGRIDQKERTRRERAMEAVGLWPLKVCADKLSSAVERANARGITSTQIMKIWGVTRRSFYEYLSPDNNRLMPVDVSARIARFINELDELEKGGTRAKKAESAAVEGAGSNGHQSKLPNDIVPLPLEERFFAAATTLFGEYYMKRGFKPLDENRLAALKLLVAETPYSHRTISRLLPPYGEGLRGRRLRSAVVESFEEIARRHGRIVGQPA